MTKYWTSTGSFLDACLGPGGVVCAAIVDDQMAREGGGFTKIAALKDGQWMGAASLNWDVVTVTRCVLPIAQYAVLGVLGNVFFFGSGDIHEERIQDGPVGPDSLGPLRSARSIYGRLYACGMQRQVYMRTARDSWSVLSASIHPKDGVFGFESLDGYSSTDLYAAGWQGEIWHFDGTNWRAIDVGTNTILTDVVCAGDGQVYAIGRGRKLVVGRDNSWQIHDLSLPVELTSLAWFHDTLYACSTRDAFSWNGRHFEPIRIPGDRPATFQYLSVGEENLCSVGAKDLFRFDGTQWFRID